MGLLDTIKSLFAPSSTWMPEPRRLDRGSEEALARSLQQLLQGERGWITFAEARQLFSTMDDEGKRKLASFAAEQKCDVDLMPKEGRVYFVLKS